VLLTLALPLTWILIAVIATALGAPLLRRLAGAPADRCQAMHAAWAGAALLLVFLSLWHYLLPVDERAIAAVAIAAAVAGWSERRWLAAIARRPLDPRAVLFAAALALWIANHALGPAGMDDFNYEFQAIRWNHDYPIVPGLANLHARLGFNNAHHLLGALLSVGPWRGGVNHVINGFFVALTLLYLSQAALRLAARRDAPPDRASIVASLLIGPCAGLVLFGIYGPMISTLKADVLVAAATAMAAVLAVRSLGADDGADADAARVTLILICTAIGMVKLTGAFFAAAIGLAAVLRGLRGARRGATIAAALVAAIGAVTSMVSGWLLSGYPFYPLPWLARRFDWTVPAAQAAANRAFATSWAELRPTYDPAAVRGWSWIRPWARETLQTDRFTLLLPLLLVIACLPFMIRARPRRAGEARGLALPAAVAAAAILPWFTQAPAARFGMMLIWVAFACIFTLIVSRREPSARYDGLVASACATVCCAALLGAAGVPLSKWTLPIVTAGWSGVWIVTALDAASAGRWPAFAALCAILAIAQPLERAAVSVLKGRFGEVRDMIAIAVPRAPARAAPPQDVDPRATDSGLVVNVVKESRYDTPLPNTRFFSRHLELRTPPDLAGGFRNRSNDASEYDLAIDLPK
jgi:hypothetical protein